MPGDSLAARLEEGELVTFPTAPIPLPTDDDRAFLLKQRLEGTKEILFDPATTKVTGYRHKSAEQAERLQRLLQDLYARSAAWLVAQLPEYPPLWRPDLARLHVEEEVTRRLRFMARNDLLHLDAMFSRPTNGARILRFYVNLHPTDDRVWVTSHRVEKLLDSYGLLAGIGQANVETWFENRIVRLFRPRRPAMSPYDVFLNRFHRFLKSSDHFQEFAPRHVWKFPPGSAWLVFTDGLSHAELRGCGVLDCTFLIAPQSLVRPEKSPAALMQRLAAPHSRAG